MSDEIRGLTPKGKARAGTRAQKAARLAKADPTGWRVHIPYHWSIILNGHQLDYWPTVAKWRYCGKMHLGDPVGFITARNPDWRAG